MTAVPQNVAAPTSAAPTPATTPATTTATTVHASAPAQAGPPPAAVPVQADAAPREEGATRAEHAVVTHDGERDPIVSTASSSPDAQTDTRERGPGASQPHQPTSVRSEAAPSAFPAGPALMLLTTPDGTLRLFPAANLSLLAAPAAASAAETADNIERLVGSMRVMTRDQVSQATIHLRPEHFGEVSINVRVDGKAVTAVIQTDSPQVREWLQAQEGTLRTGLAEQGLQLDRLHVSRDPRHDRRDAQHQQPDRRRQRRRDEPQTGTFEIAV